MMKKNIAILLTILLSTSIGFSQIPIEEYRAEIEQLKTDTQVNEYWNNLYKIDQEILVNTSNLKITQGQQHQPGHQIRRVSRSPRPALLWMCRL